MEHLLPPGVQPPFRIPFIQRVPDEDGEAATDDDCRALFSRSNPSRNRNLQLLSMSSSEYGSNTAVTKPAS